MAKAEGNSSGIIDPNLRREARRSRTGAKKTPLLIEIKPGLANVPGDTVAQNSIAPQAASNALLIILPIKI
jgi:hypothetical protein